MPSCSKKSMSLKKQISTILCTSQKSFTIEHVDVQRQIGTSDCGLFAIAFAVALCYGHDPHMYKYIQDSMRHHLIDCFNKHSMAPFPSKPIRSRPERILYEQNCTVYCICRQPWDKSDCSMGPLVYCGTCNEWYHKGCLSINSELFEDSSATFVCPVC